MTYIIKEFKDKIHSIFQNRCCNHGNTEETIEILDFWFHSNGNYIFIVGKQCTC